jgi:hypothetical protein
LERSLFETGFVALLVRQGELSSSALLSVLYALWSAGVVVVYAGELTSQERGAIQAVAQDRLFEFPAAENSTTAAEILRQALSVAAALRIASNFPDKEALDRT